MGDVCKICKKKMAESSQLILPLILDDYNYNYDDGDYFDDFGVSDRFQIYLLIVTYFLRY